LQKNKMETIVMWQHFIEQSFRNPLLLSIFFASLVLSILFFILSRVEEDIKKKVFFLYIHVAFLFIPLIVATISWQCEMGFLECTPRKIIAITPMAAFTLFSIGFLLVPVIYRRINQSYKIENKNILLFIEEQSKLLKIKAPDILYIRTKKTFAHTFTHIRPTIFISTELLSRLNKKEIEAVILHELYHIKQRSSFTKFSSFFLKLVSPVATFVSFEKSLQTEERMADKHAIKIQKTKRYLTSAKKKLICCVL